MLASHPVTLWVFLLYATYPFLIILSVLCYDYLPCTEHDDYPHCIKHNDSLFHALSMMISFSCVECYDPFHRLSVMSPPLCVDCDDTFFIMVWVLIHVMGIHHSSFIVLCIYTSCCLIYHPFLHILLIPF